MQIEIVSRSREGHKRHAGAWRGRYSPGANFHFSLVLFHFSLFLSIILFLSLLLLLLMLPLLLLLMLPLLLVFFFLVSPQLLPSVLPWDKKRCWRNLKTQMDF